MTEPSQEAVELLAHIGYTTHTGWQWDHIEDNEFQKRHWRQWAKSRLQELLPAIQAQAKAPLEAEIERLKKRQEFTKEWYAVRIRRIEDTAKREGIWPEIACILANGTAGAEKEPYEYEPPTYAQQLNAAKYRAEKAEKERDQAKAQALAELREELLEVKAGLHPDSICAQCEHQRLLIERLLFKLDKEGEGE